MGIDDRSLFLSLSLRSRQLLDRSLLLRLSLRSISLFLTDFIFLESRRQLAVNNLDRVARTWMSPKYYEFFSSQRLEQGLDITNKNDDRSDALQFRSKCNSFDWFMNRVAYNNSLYFPPKQIASLAEGKLKNVGNGFCVGLARTGRFLKFYECEKVTQTVTFEWWESITIRLGFIYQISYHAVYLRRLILVNH